MRTFTAKTIEEALELAVGELGVESASELVYKVVEEKKGLFKKVATIEVIEPIDEANYAVEYLTTVIKAFDINPTITAEIKEGMIFIDVDSDHNSILIGKNGRTLQALTEITKLAAAVRFEKRVHLLVDVNNYKEGRYRKVVSMAKNVAKEVQRTKVEAKLDPMPADERRRVHNALTKFSNIKTESVGNGHRRQIIIKYVD